MAMNLVTGAAGFLGRSLVIALLARGEGVIAFDVQPQPDDPRLGLADWRRGDVRNLSALVKASVNSDTIYHLASIIPQRKEPAETMREVNVGGTQAVLSAAKTNHVPRVVYLSSVEIFGAPKMVPCPEDGPLAPLGEYGRNKIAAEALCRQAGSDGLEVTILRPMTIVGSGLTEPFILGLLEAIRAGKQVTILGSGSNHFQLIHVEDVVQACILAAHQPEAAGKAFNIGSQDVPSIREMMSEVIRRVGSPSRITSVPVPLARLAVSALRLFGKAPLEPEHLAIAVCDYLFDTRLAGSILGWKPCWGSVESVLSAYYGSNQLKQTH